jgi:arylformamidase
MPYILSPLITEDSEGMWFEGAAYTKDQIYSIVPGIVPPVNYDQHTLKSHSITHIEAPKHVSNDGKTVDKYFNKSHVFGGCTVVKLSGNNYKEVGDGIYHWEVSLTELQHALNNKIPKKLLLSTQIYHKNKDGYHDPNYVLTLGLEAAQWLISSKDFNFYGTSWKSSDYAPGSMERPIHKTLFRQAVIAECLDLENVPAGDYFIVAYPLRLENSSESPVTPVLFRYDELKNNI